MALYALEILDSTNSPKGLNLIGELTGMSQEEVRRRLEGRLPWVVKEAIPLAEAVTVERQLRRLGVNSRVVKMNVSLEKVTEESESNEESPSDVIVIPDEDVHVLGDWQEEAPKPKIVRRRLSPAARRKVWLFGVAGGLAVLAAALLLVRLTRLQNTRAELDLSMNQWQRTLRQQETLLDDNVTPGDILGKLTELEHKVDYLVRLLGSGERRRYTARFDSLRSQAENRRYLQDLEFRRYLENAGFSLHPICLVEPHQVRGSSELPEGARLRVRLRGDENIEMEAYPVEIQEGIFRLMLDPAVAGSVYDATATIEALSQQPPKVQAWAQSMFPLTGEQEPGADATSPAALVTAAPANLPPPSDSVLIPPAATDFPPLRADASDADIAAALESAIMGWSSLVRSADAILPGSESYSLEELYQRLLAIEARIDYLIARLHSEETRNRWILAREEAYGAFVAVRHGLVRWHEAFLARNNPVYLETAIRRRLGIRGLTEAQVLVLDSPQTQERFMISVEIPGENPQELLPTLAQTLVEETGKVHLDIEQIQLRCAAGSYAWTLEALSGAVEALRQPDGERRSATLLEQGRIGRP